MSRLSFAEYLVPPEHHPMFAVDPDDLDDGDADEVTVRTNVNARLLGCAHASDETCRVCGRDAGP